VPPYLEAILSLHHLCSCRKEKWDSSGGNEALGRVAASIPESTKTMVGSMFRREHFRGPTVFFGFGEERAFYVEKIPSLLMDRVRHNITFFYLNYMAIIAILFCLTLLVSPSAIIGIGLLAGAWFWLVRASQDGTLRISSTIGIPQKSAVIVMAVITLMVLVYLLRSIFWWTLFWSGLLIVVHAFLRDASMHKDMDDAVAMEGDFQINGDEANASSPFLERV
jgi:PRA1 family protein